MFELYGKYTSAQIYANEIEPEAISQIQELINQSFTKDCKVAIMADVHAGKGCTVGFTANLGNKIVPNLVGVDIGCGMLTIPLGKINIDLEKFDKIVKTKIASGTGNYNNKILYEFNELKQLNCYNLIKHKENDILKALSSLGSGNHFIELDKDNEDNIYLIIHTGSRNLGKQICDYYQKQAIAYCHNVETDVKDVIQQLKDQNRQNEISDIIRSVKANTDKTPKELCYLEGQLKENYFYDMNIAQKYATLNRIYIAKQILKNYFYPADIHLSTGFKLKIKSKGFKFSSEAFETIHNYINFNDNILRKGAIASYVGEPLLIPINMRDGCIYGVGKSNPEMNFSAPHGAGRLMSRSKAKNTINLQDFKESMKDVYSTTVCEGTLDEAPMAYKSINTILENIKDTVEVIAIWKPIYNFKAIEKSDRGWK